MGPKKKHLISSLSQSLEAFKQTGEDGLQSFQDVLLKWNTDQTRQIHLSDIRL